MFDEQRLCEMMVTSVSTINLHLNSLNIGSLWNVGSLKKHDNNNNTTTLTVKVHHAPAPCRRPRGNSGPESSACRHPSGDQHVPDQNTYCDDVAWLIIHTYCSKIYSKVSKNMGIVQYMSYVFSVKWPIHQQISHEQVS